MPPFKDLSGQRFGKLVVLHRVENHGKQTAFLCQCDCGNTKKTTGRNLQRNDAKSCGCLPHAYPVHGQIHTSEYQTWADMLQRCYNPKIRAYHNYGARGIVVVERWHTAAHFLADMGPRPSRQHTLERRDNNGPYAPENCYWATRSRQARNRRDARLVTYNGIAKPLADWCDDYNKNISTVCHRLHVLHWNIHDALTITPNRNGNRQRR